jgi:RsiW-degrading membrane proteinase PrsW (M82 family)
MIPAGYLEGFLERTFLTGSMGIKGDFISAFFIVGLVEELLKFLVIMIVAYKRKAFNEPYDGITYSVMVSLGFATIENILYIFEDREISTALSRMFLAVPAHTVFGVIMGFFVGLARFGKKPILNLVLAVATAAALHGTYDFSLFVDDMPFMALGAIVSLIIGIVLSIIAIRIHRKNSPFKPTVS